MPERESFVMYTEWGDQIDKLPDEEAGKLFKAVFQYQKKQMVSKLPIASDMALSFMISRFDKDKAKYETTCEKRKNAGKQGGRPPKAKKANGLFEKQDDHPPPGEGEGDNDCEGQEITTAATAREAQLKRLSQFFEGNNFGRMGHSIIDDMAAYLDEGADTLLIERCMKEAVDCGTPTWAYARKVLERCIGQKIETVGQFEAEKAAKAAGRTAVKSLGGKSGAISNPFLREDL